MRGCWGWVSFTIEHAEFSRDLGQKFKLLQSEVVNTGKKGIIIVKDIAMIATEPDCITQLQTGGFPADSQSWKKKHP